MHFEGLLYPQMSTASATVVSCSALDPVQYHWGRIKWAFSCQMACAPFALSKALS